VSFCDLSSRETEDHAEDALEIRSALENLCCLRAAIRVAQKVGEGLGTGKDLLGSL